VLLDEVEQHLHPKWQRRVVHDLKDLFPRVQFIATTHSPLVASSIGQLVSENSNDKLVHLGLGEGHIVDEHIFKDDELQSMKGLQVDQILASKVFDYQIDSDREVEKFLAKASELASKGDRRNSAEDREYKKAKSIFKSIMQPEGRSDFERISQEELYQEIEKRIKSSELKLFGRNNDTN